MEYLAKLGVVLDGNIGLHFLIQKSTPMTTGARNMAQTIHNHPSISMDGYTITVQRTAVPSISALRLNGVRLTRLRLKSEDERIKADGGAAILLQRGTHWVNTDLPRPHSRIRGEPGLHPRPFFCIDHLAGISFQLSLLHLCRDHPFGFTRRRRTCDKKWRMAVEDPSFEYQ